MSIERENYEKNKKILKKGEKMKNKIAVKDKNNKTICFYYPDNRCIEIKSKNQAITNIIVDKNNRIHVTYQKNNSR